jgi:hypothetical protein
MNQLRITVLAIVLLALTVPHVHAQSARIYPRFVQPSIWTSTTIEARASRLGIDHYMSLATSVDVGGAYVGMSGYVRTNKHQVASWSSNDQQDNAWMTYAFLKAEIGRILITRLLTCTSEITTGLGLARQSSHFCGVTTTTTNAIALAELALQLRITPSRALSMSLDLSAFYSPSFVTAQLVAVPRPTVGIAVRVMPWK